MAAREDILEIVRGLFSDSQRAPQTYDFDDLPQTGIYDEDAEEAEKITYNNYRILMPVTIEQIDFFQSAGAAADPGARNLLRAQKASSMLDTIVTTVLNSSALQANSAFDRVQYSTGQPVYFDESSNYVGVAVTFVIVYNDDYS